MSKVARPMNAPILSGWAGNSESRAGTGSIPRVQLQRREAHEDTIGTNDTLGEVEVPADRYWGAQTPRRWRISPSAANACREQLIRAFGVQKKAAALVNASPGRLDPGSGRR